MTDRTPTSDPVAAAWAELVFDALASDGPIRDSDVKDAVKRNRPRIEEAIRQQARAAYGQVHAESERQLREWQDRAIAAEIALAASPEPASPDE